MPAVSESTLYSGLMHIIQSGYDLTARQVMVLMLIYMGPQRIRIMARAMNVGVPAISRAADRLETEGLAVRNEDPDDRRSVLLQPTETGYRLVSAALKIHTKEFIR